MTNLEVMQFTREGCKPVLRPSDAVFRRDLQRMKSSFAVLSAESGEFLQVAGGPGLFLLERSESSGKHFRGSQQHSVVPFEDGTLLAFSGGQVSLAQNEWFLIGQIVEAMVSFSTGNPLPSFIEWRELNESYLPVAIPLRSDP